LSLRPQMSSGGRNQAGKTSGAKLSGPGLRPVLSPPVARGLRQGLGWKGRSPLVASRAVSDQEHQPSVDINLKQLTLENHPNLHIGKLSNGLRYVILPNPSPPNRFEAHLEVHAGSVDEEEEEQGIAHLVEHCTFLGSKRREGLLGTGARSNAYTDFHHTVFHVHAPHANANNGQPMLPAVLDALTEIGFEPEMLPARIEKERKAVTAEAQMMNTIEYRVDCQLLQYLHWENALGCRFPIGKMDQVQRWTRDEVYNFWQKHYYPENATLYVVGDVDVKETERLIQENFGRVPAHSGGKRAAKNDGLDAQVLAESSDGAEANGNRGDGEGRSDLRETNTGLLLERAHLSPAGLIRPPVEHQWGCEPMIQTGFQAPISVFRHRLLQLFQLSIFCKLPIQPMKTLDDLKRAFMVRVMLSVMQFRINARYVAADPPFIGIELDHSDSGREGCAVSTLTITSEPKDWRGAVQVAIQEVRRLQQHGVTAAELERYKSALLRDSEQLAEGADSVPSLDNLEFVMESMALGHAVIEQRQAHEYLLQLADTITPEEVSAICKSILSFSSHYGDEASLLQEYQADPGKWATPGPSIATAVVACLPTFMDASGNSSGAAAPMQRGASLATTQHVDPSIAAAALDDTASDEEPPEGAVRFEIDEAEIREAISEKGLEIEALEDVDVPDSLVSDEDAIALVNRLNPAFVAVDAGSPETRPAADPATGVVRRRLSNGIMVNYRKTDNEPMGAMVRVVAAGGRALEERGVLGPDGHGVVAVGTRTLSESGTVGDWDRAQVELFCISRLINCVLEANEEFICMDFHFAVGDGGMAAVLQLLHLFLEAPRWEEAAMERSKQMYVSHYRALPKSLERATADRIMQSMLGSDRRFRDPSTEEIAALTLEAMKENVMAQLHAGNLEISIVGDFDEGDLEDSILTYLGTVEPKPDMPGAGDAISQCPTVCSPPLEERHSVWHLKDSDERACAYIAGIAPCRWGEFGKQQEPLVPMDAASIPSPPPPPAPGATQEEIDRNRELRRRHPLYASATLGLLSEMINSRLFTTVRDTLGLTYDVSFEMSLFDRLPTGWFYVNVTSTPQKIKDAMMASMRVLRSGSIQPFTSRDLLRAKRTLITRHESDLKDNGYWLALLTHIQSPAVPLKSVECLRDMTLMYDAITVDDIYEAYNHFDFSDEATFTCIGTSGQEATLFDSPILQTRIQAKGTGSGAPGEVDPEAFLNAIKNFMDNMQNS
jgi:predicted Zn-dependent peptidase